MLRLVADARAVAMFLSLLLSSGPAPADSIQLPLPAEVVMNKEAGRGGWLIVSVRLESGEELPMIVDTGAPIMLLDTCLAPRLGTRLDTTIIRSFRGEQSGGVYAAPKFYLGSVPLLTGSNLIVCNFSKLMSRSKPPIKGILGMDCLRHYCFQLDFEAGKMRFLKSGHLNPSVLGKAFPLRLTADGENRDGEIRPTIQHAGLLGDVGTNSVIDTGNNEDGMAKARSIRRHADGSYSGSGWKRLKHFLAVEGLVNRDVVLPGCVWDGNTYTNIAVGRGPGDAPNWIGLRFLARHLVTFDFPNQTLYLKQIRVGPIGRP
jgi:hypothetical protein